MNFRGVLEQVESLAHNVRSFRIKLVEPPTIEFQAGQFVIINVPKNGAVIKRAYSIASPPHEPATIELCIQHVEAGIASTYFWNLKGGEPISLSGPHGKFLLKEPWDYEPVFIATGTGVAPLRAMIRHLLYKNFPGDISLFFGTRYEHSLLYESEFRQWASARRNFHYYPTVSRPKDWHGEVGHVQQTFQKYVKDSTKKELYLCGWSEVIKSVCRDLEGFGVPKDKLHYEEWA